MKKSSFLSASLLSFVRLSLTSPLGDDLKVIRGASTTASIALDMASKTSACGVTPLASPSPGYHCNVYATLSSPAVLLDGFNTNSYLACAGVCQAAQQCISFGWEIATLGCTLYSLPLINMGYVMQSTGPVKYANRHCFACSTSSATTTGPSTITQTSGSVAYTSTVATTVDGTPTSVIIDNEPTPAPTAPFDATSDAFIVSGNSLITINRTTGVESVITTQISTAGSNFTCLGYNLLDNYLYGFDNSHKQVVRIYGDGHGVVVATNKALGQLFGGDVDSSGTFWVLNQVGHSVSWAQVDLIPGSSTYGLVLATGNTPINTRIADWVSIPEGGDYLYSIGTDYNTGQFSMVQFDTSAQTFSTSYTYNLFATGGSKGSMPSLFGENNSTGTIWGIDQNSGILYSFGLDGSPPYEIGSSGNAGVDGARCVTNID